MFSRMKVDRRTGLPFDVGELPVQLHNGQHDAS
jgi:hypothetical protein